MIKIIPKNYFNKNIIILIYNNKLKLDLYDILEKVTL